MRNAVAAMQGMGYELDEGQPYWTTLWHHSATISPQNTLDFFKDFPSNIITAY